MSKVSACCGQRVKRYVKSRNRGSGVICSGCNKPCKIKSEPVPAPDRLLTDDEITAAVKTIQHPVDSHWIDVIYLANKAQDAKSYKIGFEQGYAKAKSEV